MNINAALPVANPGGPYTVNVGGTVALSGAASRGTGLTYAGALNGNGIFGETGSAATSGNETGVSPTFKAGNLPGAYVVTLKVTDAFSQTSTATVVVTVLHSSSHADDCGSFNRERKRSLYPQSYRDRVRCLGDLEMGHQLGRWQRHSDG